MRSDVSTERRGHRVKGGSVIFLLLAGLSAGCSTDALRFGQDGFYNSAVPTQNDVDSMSTGSVNGRIDDRLTARGPVRPSADVGAMGTTSGPAPVYAAAAPASPNYRTASATTNYPRMPVYDRRQLPAAGNGSAVVSAPLLAPPSGSDGVTTGSVARTVASAPVASSPSATPQQHAAAAPQQNLAAKTDRGGWSGEGTKVQIGPGETVYSLSRRYGVPVQAIKAANRLGDASEVQAGQTLIIPRYSYGKNVSNSSPDSDPKVAALGRATASVPAESSVQAMPDREPAEGQYRVVAGDTLAGIARRAHTSVSALKAANRMSDDTIRIGQTLRLPGHEVASSGAAGTAARVDPIATGPVESKTARPKLATYEKPKTDEPKTIAKLESSTKEKAPAATGVSKLRWPAKGRVIRNYGGGNSGIDIAVPMGTPVKAAENGVVVYAGNGLKDLGNTVLVQHADGTTTVYGNASELSVKKGDKVARGQQIARAGTTGNASAPQVHFEVRKDSNPVDPSKWLE